MATTTTMSTAAKITRTILAGAILYCLYLQTVIFKCVNDHQTYREMGDSGPVLMQQAANMLDQNHTIILKETSHRKPRDLPLQQQNFYDIVQENGLASKECMTCLQKRDRKTPRDCTSCASNCSGYCNLLCKATVTPKVVTKSIVVKPPRRTGNARLIPRIIHQTYYETIDPTKYPNWSRFVKSFELSGWDYRFYTDEMIEQFLKTHFPQEVFEAYTALVPGAFKADLFRYCVLLIHGGVYADVDVLLESNLDAIVEPDIGFMVPLDVPGRKEEHQYCVWNGLMAAAPGHPFLVKVLEMVVNNVRNRFTNLDMDNLFCPTPVLSVQHFYDYLHFTGPCILGAAMNTVLGRHGQSHFTAGEMDIPNLTTPSWMEKGTDSISGPYKDPFQKLPGRVVLLRQNKWDLSAQRFTFIEKNAIVAATDFEDQHEDDSDEDKDGGDEHLHYFGFRTLITGSKLVYDNTERANEDIRIYIDSSDESK